MEGGGGWPWKEAVRRQRRRDTDAAKQGMQACDAPAWEGSRYCFGGVYLGGRNLGRCLFSSRDVKIGECIRGRCGPAEAAAHPA